MPDIQVLMQGAPGWLQEIQRVLRARGIHAELLAPQAMGQPAG